MTKRLFLTLILLISAKKLFSQDNIPCEFSWQNAPTTTGIKNFVTDVREQNDQGPCLAFAFNAAIETMYGIEQNKDATNLFNLSDAYLDYKAWNAPDYLPVLNNSGFKIPVQAPPLNGFAETCNPDRINFPCGWRNDIIKFIEDPSGQKSYKFQIDLDGDDQQVRTIVVGKDFTQDYVIVKKAYELTTNTIRTIDDIKQRILNHGPVVLRVSGNKNGGLHNATNFRNYTLPDVGLNFHAFTIIGWTKDNEWIIKDSWPRMEGIVKTKPNTDIIGLMNTSLNNSGTKKAVELYQVSRVSFNGGNIPSTPKTKLSINNCEPEQETAINLSPISVGIDYVYIGGYLYHKFWTNSNVPVERWVWGIDYPNGSLKRSQINSPNSSSVLLSPTTSGNVTVYVNAYIGGKIVATKKRNIYLSNGKVIGNGGIGDRF